MRAAVERVWEMLSAFFSILTISLQRDIESWKRGSDDHPYYTDYNYACYVGGVIPTKEGKAAFDAVAVSRKSRGR